MDYLYVVQHINTNQEVVEYNARNWPNLLKCGFFCNFALRITKDVKGPHIHSLEPLTFNH